MRCVCNSVYNVYLLHLDAISFYLMCNISMFNISPTPFAYCPHLSVQYLFINVYNMQNCISSLSVLSDREGCKIE